MKIFSQIIQILISLLLILLVSIQSGGSGLGATFGSTSYHSKKGFEKIVFTGTIVVAFLFLTTSILNIFLF